MSSDLGMNGGRVKRARSALVLGVGLLALSVAGMASARPPSVDRHHRTRAHAHRAPSRAAAAGNVALFNREAVSYSSRLPLPQEARRYRVMVLQAPFGWLVPRLHRYNRRLQVYMYQFVMFARADDPQGLELCTSLPAARAHNWFLRGPGGQVLTSGGSFGLDPGIPSFQRSCAAHAAALAKRYGFDGIFLDGVGALPDYQFHRTVSVPKYPTQRRWVNAMTAFLQTMSRIVHARGVKVIANLGGPQLWLRWSPLLDGAEEESWTDGGLGLAQQIPWWRQKLDNVAWSEAHGKLVLLHSYNSTEAANVYGLASMLLVAAGHSTYSTSNANYLGAEDWYPEYASARRLGAPLGHYFRLRSGVYERRFANGLVLVNPTRRSVARIRLRGAYSGTGLSHARTVAMGPTSGLILLRG
jgi:hypothetical protein